MPAIYQADTWCDSCADEIRERIDASGDAPDDVSDERFYDSDEYPKYMPEDQESDCPQHCGSGPDCLEPETLADGSKIGALLSACLTCDGVDYVNGHIRDGGLVSEYWAEAFADYDLVDPADLLAESSECDPEGCECVNTHKAVDTVCRWCWSRGHRHWEG